MFTREERMWGRLLYTIQGPVAEQDRKPTRSEQAKKKRKRKESRSRRKENRRRKPRKKGGRR